MSVSGGASIGLKNTSKTSTAIRTKGNQLTFTGSGELDNGMNVSLSMVIDQNDDSTLTTAAQLDNSPFDSHSVTVSSDSLGSLVFSGEGGSNAAQLLILRLLVTYGIMVLVLDHLKLQKLVTTV